MKPEKTVTVKYLNGKGHETRQVLASEFCRDYPTDRVVIVEQTPVNSPAAFLARVEQDAQQAPTVYVFPPLIGG